VFYGDSKRASGVGALIEHQYPDLLGRCVDGVILGDGKAVIHCCIMLLPRQVKVECGYGRFANRPRGAYVRNQERHTARKNAAFLAQQQVPRVDPDVELRFPSVGHDSSAEPDGGIVGRALINGDQRGLLLGRLRTPIRESIVTLFCADLDSLAL